MAVLVLPGPNNVATISLRCHIPGCGCGGLGDALLHARFRKIRGGAPATVGELAAWERWEQGDKQWVALRNEVEELRQEICIRCNELPQRVQRLNVLKRWWEHVREQQAVLDRLLLSHTDYRGPVASTDASVRPVYRGIVVESRGGWSW